MSDRRSEEASRRAPEVERIERANQHDGAAGSLVHQPRTAHDTLAAAMVHQ